MLIPFTIPTTHCRGLRLPIVVGTLVGSAAVPGAARNKAPEESGFSHSPMSLASGGGRRNLLWHTAFPQPRIWPQQAPFEQGLGLCWGMGRGILSVWTDG